jgi:hypothetical protein
MKMGAYADVPLSTLLQRSEGLLAGGLIGLNDRGWPKSSPLLPDGRWIEPDGGSRAGPNLINDLVGLD